MRIRMVKLTKCGIINTGSAATHLAHARTRAHAKNQFLIKRSARLRTQQHSIGVCVCGCLALTGGFVLPDMCRRTHPSRWVAAAESARQREHAGRVNYAIFTFDTPQPSKRLRRTKSAQPPWPPLRLPSDRTRPC